MPRFWILRDDGTVRREDGKGRRLRWVQPSECSAAVLKKTGGRGPWRVLEDAPSYVDLAPDENHRIVPTGKNGTMTRAKARRMVAETGIYPYPQDVDNYLTSRRLRPDERKRHEKKISDKVKRQMGMDERVRRDVERE